MSECEFPLLLHIHEKKFIYITSKNPYKQVLLKLRSLYKTVKLEAKVINARLLTNTSVARDTCEASFYPHSSQKLHPHPLVYP